MVGFNEFKNLYTKDPKFLEAWKAYKELVTLERIKWLDYMIWDGMLFMGSQICIPSCSMKDNLIKENESGGMVGNFGQDKTIDIFSEHYFLPQLSQDVKNVV